MTQSAVPAKIVDQSQRRSGIARSMFRWIHLIFSIPVVGYIYSPFDKIPQYATPTRFIFVPVMVLSGLWMWQGHVVRRLLLRRPV